MRERKARGRTGESRFLAALGMTISLRNCQRKAKAKAKAKARAKAKAEEAPI